MPRTQVGQPHEPRNARCPQRLPGGQDWVGATGHLAPQSPTSLLSGTLGKKVSSSSLHPTRRQELEHGQSCSNLYQIPMGRTLTSGKNPRPQNHLLLYHSVSRSVVSDSLRPTRLLRPWDSPGKNTGVGCHSLLQGIFPSARDRTKVSCLAGRFFTVWATREAPLSVATTQQRPGGHKASCSPVRTSPARRKERAWF